MLLVGSLVLRPPPDVNYSAFLSCLPWASKDSEDFCKAKPVGKGPQEVSEHWMKMNAGEAGGDHFLHVAMLDCWDPLRLSIEISFPSFGVRFY